MGGAVISHRMILLLDVGNTHTHLGVARGTKITSLPNLPTEAWRSGEASGLLRKALRGRTPAGAALCSVVPRVNSAVRQCLKGVPFLELNHRTVRVIGVNYPKPQTIGPGRIRGR